MDRYNFAEQIFLDIQKVLGEEAIKPEAMALLRAEMSRQKALWYNQGLQAATGIASRWRPPGGLFSPQQFQPGVEISDEISCSMSPVPPSQLLTEVLRKEMTELKEANHRSKIKVPWMTFENVPTNAAKEEWSVYPEYSRANQERTIASRWLTTPPEPPAETVDE